MQTDIESYIEETYPYSPGYKDSDTSKLASEEIKEDAETLRMAVYSALKTQKPMTADEMSEYLNRDKLSIRPRFSELKEQGLIEDTGLRRKNISGKKAKVFRAISKG